MLAELLLKHKQYESARDFYERALQQDASQPVYYARLGGIYILLGISARALDVFKRAVQRFPENADMRYFLALAARGTGDFDLALTAVRKSLSLKANQVDALALLGTILSDRGNIAEAEASLRRAIALNDKHFNAYHDLGRLLVRSRRYEESVPILQHAETLNTSDPDVHYQLFFALSRLKRKTEADREFATYKRLSEAQKTKTN
jgi:tetratricopeptide (TPR) repeat protein